jgi:hypothetical protein
MKRNPKTEWNGEEFPCLTCGAEAHARCHDRNGRLMGAPHIARTTLWRAKIEDPSYTTTRPISGCVALSSDWLYGDEP